MDTVRRAGTWTLAVLDELACAVAARDADPDVDTLLCFDTELSDAAAREGFSLAA